MGNDLGSATHQADTESTGLLLSPEMCRVFGGVQYTMTPVNTGISICEGLAIYTCNICSTLGHSLRST